MATTAKSTRTRGSTNGLRKLVAQTFVTLDGVMQAGGGPEEDTDSGFRHGGWAMTHWDDVMGRVQTDFLSEPADVVLGRKTYDIFASFWPKHRDQIGSSLNQSTKYVASRTKEKLEWENSILLLGDAVAAIRKLKRQPGPRLLVIGSGNLLQSLLKEDLVDELDLWVFPLVLGSGKRLFAEGAIPTAWRLASSHTSGTGVQINHYERAGDVQYGRPPGA